MPAMKKDVKQGNFSLLDFPLFSHYKNRMKRTRRLLGLLLVLALSACSILPNLPTIPPGWTVTPSVTITPPPTFTPTVTPTPLPIARVYSGDHALFNGDYETALALYQTAFQDSPDPLVQAAAKWGEARIHFTETRYQEALNSLQTLITTYPDSAHMGQAHYLQGFAQYRMGNYRAAADSWQTYLVLRPGYLDAYVQEYRGDALYEAQDFPAALAAYTAAIQSDKVGDDILIDIKVAATHSKMANYDLALAIYDGIFTRAQSDYTKAQAAYESGLAYLALNKKEEAQGKFRLAIESYPLSYHAYLSLLALLEAGGEVSDLDRGLVDYFAGQYDVAIAAFDRYLSANTDDGTAHYYRALSLRDRGDYNTAVKEFAAYLNDYPSHPRWADAWGEKAFIEWYQLGSHNEAAQTLLNFVAAVPSSETSANYLMSAARIYERGGKYEEALQTWARVANEYNGTEQAASASFLMGVIYYRNGEFNAALEAFNRNLAASTQKSDQARANLWVGKTQKQLGNLQAATEAWRKAQDRDPGGYYSERARDLLLERAPFTPPISTRLTADLQAERKDADSWLRLTFNLPGETDLSGLGALANEPRIIRGTELWQIGMYEEARAEFESLRKEMEANRNAEGSYRLTNYLLELGLYHPAIFSARQTLAIAGLDEHAESMMAPIYFSHVRYGLYYSDLITRDAAANQLDPLFLFSVVRQESLFEGFITSSANARGLMQVIPSTGADMATQLNWPPNYDETDLYRPDVSVAFGARYLNNNRNALDDGNMYVTLAAYNGGPGNALEWKRLSGDDPDLFLETVRFEETRNYIRNIYEIYSIYKRLYGTTE